MLEEHFLPADLLAAPEIGEQEVEQILPLDGLVNKFDELPERQSPQRRGIADAFHGR
ncbi:hypothetical protein D3C73_1446350 [compost metagenome]